MHKVGTRVHTAHGDGEVTEVETVRGRTEYRVAGRGFNVYIEASKLQVASNPADRAHDTWASSKDKGRAEHEKHDLSPEYYDDPHNPEGNSHNVWGNLGSAANWWSTHEAGLNDTIDPGRPYEVNKDNSTTLPYDYTPQHHVDMFQGEQTIQPGDHEIDPDERLHASDSLTGEQRKDNRPYPGPNPDLFAKSARSEYDGPEPGDDPHYEQHSHDLAHEREQDEHAAQHPGWPHHAAFEDTSPEWGDDEWHEGLPDGPERTGGWAGPYGDHENTSPEEHGEVSRVMNDHFDRQKINEDIRNHHEGASYRPAGLSNRYAHIMEAEDHTEIGMFRRDPVGYQQRLAHVMIAGEEDSLIEKFADYTNLLDGDEHMRTAAWKDVAAKAKRLRSEGAVHPKDIGPNRIMAMVDGDGAQYQTLVLRGPGYAGMGKGANSATFSCTCQWGKWAFKRQFTFVGRMCSHALATLWELQSHSNKGNGGKFKSAAVTDDFKKWADDYNDGHIDQGCIHDFLNTQDEDYTREDVNKLYDYVAEHHQQAPERDYDIDYTLDNEKAYKTAEILRTRPMSLTPDLREVPKNDEHEWTDVTEDDRETTGPDQIVHFSKIMAALHPRMAKEGDPLGGPEDNSALTPDWKSVNTPVGPPTKAPNKFLHDFVGVGNPYVPQSKDGQPTVTMPNGQQLGGDPNYKPPPAPGYHMDPTGVGGLGGAGAPSPVHPAADAGTTHVNPTPSPGPTGQPGGPVGGPSAPGNPAAQAPSSGDSTGAGRSGPDDPNGVAGGASAIGQGTTYHVNQGDTLSDIAGRAGLGKDQYQQIADANKDLIKDPNHIETGWDLKIPGQSSSGTPGQGAAPDSSPGPHEMGKADASTPPPPAGAPPTPPQSLTGAPVGLPPGGPIAPPNPGGPPVGQQPAPGSAPIDNKPFRPTISRRRYAESSDATLLDKLRQKSVEPASDDLGHMDSRNDEIRDLVEELNDRGLDASFMVASLHYADSPADGNPDFLGISSPGWADQPFSGSGPDPRHYISDSQSYLDDHEPDLHDVTDGKDIIKFNDDRSKPQQGPRHSSIDGVRSIGGGPRNAPRIDPGVRGRRSELKHAAGLMPENEDPSSLGSMDEPDSMATPGNAIEAGYYGDDEDAVANFQRSAAAQDLMGGSSSGGGGGMFSDDAIAANAAAMLRTAGRKFTQAEQRDLEEEAHILGARNLPNNDDLAGTHYLMGI